MTKPALTIELLGSLRIRQGDRVLIEFPPQQTGVLLAYIALHAPRAFTREEVIEALWPGLDTEAGQRKLRQCIYILHRELKMQSLSNEHLILTTRDRIRLNPEAARTDVAAFEETLRAASTASDVGERIPLLTSAVALYRGELLPGFYGDGFQAERYRLADVCRSALMALVYAYKEAGDLPRALDYAQRALALDTLQEEAHCEVMRLYAATGQTAAALRQYQKLADILREDIDAEPSVETQRIMQSLRMNGKEAASTPTESPPSAPQTASPTPALAESPVAPVLPPAAVMLSPIVVSSPASRPAYRILATGLLALLAFGLVWGLRARHLSVAHRASELSGTNVHSPSGVYGQEAFVRLMEELPGDKGSQPTAIAVDNAGDVYVTGFVDTEKHDVDFVTIKYHSDGKQLWQRRYNGAANDCDRARSLAVDNQGNVYVTGDSYNGDIENGGTDYDVVTIKYDAGGNQQWTRRYDSPTHGADFGKKVALDGAGFIYVGAASTIKTAGGTPRQDFVLLKYDMDGNLKWERRYSNTEQGEGTLNDMAVDAAGNVFMTGSAKDSAGHSNVLTMKYDTDGHRKWAQRYIGPGHGENGGARLMLDTRGNVYVAGGAYTSKENSQTGTYLLTLKYDLNGNLQWQRIDPDRYYGDAHPSAIAVDTAGNVIVVGSGLEAHSEMLIYAFTNYGLKKWDKTRDTYRKGEGDWLDANRAKDIAVDRAGNIYVAGNLYNAQAGTDCATLKYAPDGELQWLRLYQGSGFGFNAGSAMATSSRGGVVVTGISQGKSHGSIYTMWYSP